VYTVVSTTLIGGSHLVGRGERMAAGTLRGRAGENFWWGWWGGR
jgi:hypothetical protein